MTETDVYSQILREDIPEEYWDLLDTLGREAFFKLIRLCGGLNMYIPKMESLGRNARDREIRALFNGGNHKALAVQFRLSARQIHKIINGKRT